MGLAYMGHLVQHGEFGRMGCFCAAQLYNSKRQRRGMTFADVVSAQWDG